MIIWPVLARLDCGHFKTFSFEDSPAMREVVRCGDCGLPREVHAAVSVADLVRLVDRQMGVTT